MTEIIFLGFERSPENGTELGTHPGRGVVETEFFWQPWGPPGVHQRVIGREKEFSGYLAMFFLSLWRNYFSDAGSF